MKTYTLVIDDDRDMRAIVDALGFRKIQMRKIIEGPNREEIVIKSAQAEYDRVAKLSKKFHEEWNKE